MAKKSPPFKRLLWSWARNTAQSMKPKEILVLHMAQLDIG